MKSCRTVGSIWTRHSSPCRRSKPAHPRSKKFGTTSGSACKCATKLVLSLLDIMQLFVFQRGGNRCHFQASSCSGRAPCSYLQRHVSPCGMTQSATLIVVCIKLFNTECVLVFCDPAGCVIAWHNDNASQVFLLPWHIIGFEQTQRAAG